MDASGWVAFEWNLAEFGGLLAGIVVLLWISPLRLRHTITVQPGSRNGFSIQRGLVWIAWAGLAMGIFCWFQVNFATVYAPGYKEAQFSRVHVGMTRAEVESILGPPLRRDATSQRWSTLENWIYSDPVPPGRISGNYWRRWVMFDRGIDGKVVAIVSDYYEN